MFPPARLPLPEALEDHRAARASDESWMLARFVCPASRLHELPPGLSLSAVVVDGAPDALGAAEAFEVRATDPDAIRDFPRLDAEIYFEITDPRLIDAIRERRAAAKIRCGGGTVPSITELATFIRTCRDSDVPFKATA